MSRVGASALGTLLAVLTACGYHSEGGGMLPGGARAVRVAPPEVLRGAEPSLGPELSRELCRELSAAGVAASSAGRAAAVLHSRVVSLSGQGDVVLSAGATLVARPLQLSLELWLKHRGEVVWRSGLVQARVSWSQDQAQPRRTLAARQRALRELVLAAAQEAVLRLTVDQRRGSKGRRGKL